MELARRLHRHEGHAPAELHAPVPGPDRGAAPAPPRAGGVLGRMPLTVLRAPALAARGVRSDGPARRATWRLVARDTGGAQRSHRQLLLPEAPRRKSSL